MRSSTRTQRGYLAITYSAVLMGLLSLTEVSAHADVAELTITVAGYPSWPDAVAALQATRTAEGREILVGVQRGGASVPCGEYSLTLDAVGAAAFTLGTCNPRNQATPLVLSHRSELFAHDDIVPRPRNAGISVVEILSGGAAGGAETPGEPNYVAPWRFVRISSTWSTEAVSI